MQTARLLKNGRGQAVRLPKEFQFEGDRVYIKRVGSSAMSGCPRLRPQSCDLACKRAGISLRISGRWSNF